MCESLAFMDTWFPVLNVLVTYLPTPKPVPISSNFCSLSFVMC